MGSIFASDTQVTLPIPFDAGREVTIRKLAGRHLAKAQQAYFNATVEGIRERGGAAVQKDLEQLFAKVDKDPAGDEAKKLAEVKADPLAGYDKHTLIVYGVISWNYDTPLPPLTELEARKAAIDDLDEDAVDFFATEIMRLTKPRLFQTAEEAAADRKND